MKKSNPHKKSEELLRKSGFRITESRVALLDLLIKKRTPMTVEDIQSHLNGTMNKTTTYRALDDFVEKKILYKTHFQDGKAYYEYQSTHHHHIVCTACGLKEEVSHCVSSSLPKLSKESKKFTHITGHILEFFGLCNTCNSL